MKHSDLGSSSRHLVIYSLSLVIALGINDLAKAIFEKFGGPKSSHIYAKLIYVLVVFGITLIIIYILNSTNGAMTKTDYKQNKKQMKKSIKDARN